MLNKELKPKQVLIFFGGLLLVAALYFLISGQFRSYRSLTQSVQQEKTQIAQLTTRVQILEELRARGPEMQLEMLRQSRLIPPTAGEAGIMPYLQGLATGDESRIYEVRFGTNEVKKTYGVIPTKIGFEGRYTGLLELLRKMDKGDRYFRVDGVKVVPAASGLPRIKAEITAMTFYRVMP